MKKTIDDDLDYKAEVKKCKAIDYVMNKNGLMQRLVKDVLENILEGEIEEHFGRNKYERTGFTESAKKNYHNGYSSNNLRSFLGDVDLDVSGDRNAEFRVEPTYV